MMRTMTTIGSIARTPRARTATVLAFVALLAIAAAYGAIVLAGTKTGAALAFLCVAGPILGYLAILRPFLVPFGLYIALVPFDNLLALSPAGTLTRLLAAASGAVFALWLLRTRRFVVPDRSLLLWGALVLWIVASFAWALDPAEGTAPAASFAQLVALYAVVSFMPIDAERLRLLLRLTIAAGVASAAYGAWVFGHGADIAGGGRLFLANAANLSAATNFIDPNQYAAALLLPLALALGAILQARGAAARAAYAASLAVIGYGIAISGSRGALLAVGAMLAYVLLRSRRRLIVVALGVGGVALALALEPSGLARFSNAASTGGAGRSDIWSVGALALRDRWLAGAGFGNFPTAFDHAFLRVSQAYYTGWHRAPHDILLGWAVELGAIGALLLLAAWVAQVRQLRGIARDSRLYPTRVALEASLIALFVASIFLDTMTQKYLWLAFMLVALTRTAALAAPENHR